MESIQDYGLPNLVLELLDQQAKQNGLQIDFNISKRGEVVKLNLVWSPAAINSQQHNSTPTADQNIMKGFRKKNPSELARDRRRMANFHQKKKGTVKCNTEQSVQTQASSSTVDSVNLVDQNIGVKTRQQTYKLRHHSTEMPRNYQNDPGLSLFDDGQIDNVHVESPLSVTSVHSSEHNQPAMFSPQDSSQGPPVVSDLEPGHSDLADQDAESSETPTDGSDDEDNDLLASSDDTCSETRPVSEEYFMKKFDELMNVVSAYSDTHD